MDRRTFFELYKSIGINTNEASAEIDMILDYLGIDPLKEIKNGGFSKDEEASIKKIINKRIKTLMPLQYITGFGYFMGEKFFVDKNTLIPRPETELLVRECIKLTDKNSNVLDIGTGTGCIAIEIAKHTKACIDAIDISEEALKIAEKNILSHKVSINIFKSDLFSNVKKKYDLIVSNPPYIPIFDKDELSETVKDYEPHASLFTNDRFGIEIYEKIIQDAVTFLNNEGYLCFEIGQGQAGKICKLLENKGFTRIKVLKDINNNERVTIAQHFLKNTFQDNL